MVASFTNMAERKSADESVATAGRDENTQLALNQVITVGCNKRAAHDWVNTVIMHLALNRVNVTNPSMNVHPTIFFPAPPYQRLQEAYWSLGTLVFRVFDCERLHN